MYRSEKSRKILKSIINITIALCCAAGTLSLSACTVGESSSSGGKVTTSAAETENKPEKVEIKSYEFPEFLNDIKQPDMLANPVYSSFKTSDHVKEVEEQPFDDYTCTAVIDDVLYVYQSGKYKGLLSLSGNEIIEADTYAEITAVSDGLLVLSRNKELNAPDEYAYFNENGTVTMADDFSYDSANVIINEKISYDNEGASDGKNTEKKTSEIILPGGRKITDGGDLGEWDSVEEVKIDSVDTTKVFSGYYKAVKDNDYYFICLDRYYNYTIYNGAYAFVRLKVGSVYGECYILSGGDYRELTKMIKSFGSSNAVKTPSKDPALDFIQIEFGYNGDDKKIITISADGFCFTDNTAAKDQTVNKYFTKLDKESFVSLVQWVDQVLSKEYGN